MLLGTQKYKTSLLFHSALPTVHLRSAQASAMNKQSIYSNQILSPQPEECQGYASVFLHPSALPECASGCHVCCLSVRLAAMSAACLCVWLSCLLPVCASGCHVCCLSVRLAAMS